MLRSPVSTTRRPSSSTTPPLELICPPLQPVRGRSSINAEPITPPVSPNRAALDDVDHMEVDVDTQSSQASLAEVPNSQAVASEGTSSPNPAPRRQSTLSASHSEQPGPQAPLRILEDEQVHIERRGRLRLTDFQVKGSLGWFA